MLAEVFHHVVSSVSAAYQHNIQPQTLLLDDSLFIMFGDAGAVVIASRLPLKSRRAGREFPWFAETNRIVVVGQRKFKARAMLQRAPYGFSRWLSCAVNRRRVFLPRHYTRRRRRARIGALHSSSAAVSPLFSARAATPVHRILQRKAAKPAFNFRIHRVSTLRRSGCAAKSR